MVSRKSSNRVAPKTSSTIAAASSALTSRTINSAILRSAFPPSQLQLSLFASVIQSLDSQQLRVHDTFSGRIKCEHTPHQTQINCLAWGFYDSSANADTQPAKKKRKTSEQNYAQGLNHGNAVIAIGSVHPDIELFSPSEGKVVTKLKDAHDRGTKDFKFDYSKAGHEAWSLGTDGTLAQWDLVRNKRLRSISTPSNSIATLCLLPKSILLASSGTYILDRDSPKTTNFRDCFMTSIHSLISEPSVSESHDPSSFLAAARDSRSINVCSIDDSEIIGNLNAGNDVERLVSSTPPVAMTDDFDPQALAAISKDGRVDLFISPFSNWRSSEIYEQNIKINRKNKVRRPDATIEVKRVGKATPVLPILDVSFQRTELIIAINEGPSDVAFQRLSWSRNDGSLTFTGLQTITKARTSTFGTETMNGIKDLGHTHVDESRAVIVQGGDAYNGHPPEREVIEISSAEEESSGSEFEDGAMPAEEFPGTVTVVNGADNADVEMMDAEENNIVEQDNKEEPSFGDILRAKAIGTVDVSRSFVAEPDQALVPAGDKRLVASSGLSLGTILTQSLHTNDSASLENCFSVEDLQIVRATIERLNSGLAITLLQRLAERLHSRPGRAGSLLVWIQWTLVAHGGYLSSLSNAPQKLSSLYQVIGYRANGLQSLLSLKGKLDMLEAQVNLRKSSQQRHSALLSYQNQDRGDLIYVEGQEESSSEDDLSGSRALNGKIHEPESDNNDYFDNDDLDATGHAFDEDSDVEDSMDDEVSGSEQGLEDDDLGDDVDHDDVDSLDGEDAAQALAPTQQDSNRSR